MKATIFAAAVTTIAVAIGISFVASYPLMLLWNFCLVPAAPGLAQVGWLQMWGISILIGLLVKNPYVQK